MLVSTHDMLLDAQKNGYAVGAFNVENMEMVMAVIQAAEECKSPVILQTTPSTLKYASLDMFYSMCNALAKKTKVPIAIHLDHGNSYDLCVQAIRSGYTSIMIDHSQDSFETNVSESKRVIDVGRACGVSVEAELGMIGGKEDEHESSGVSYTKPEDAHEFSEATRCDSLAISIGSAHGVYKGIPKISVEALKAIRKVVTVPLVLHGSSGIPDEVVRECVENGICKVNYATDLRIEYLKATRKVLEDRQVIDPKKIGTLGMEYVKEYVMSRMKNLKSNNRVI